MDPDDPIKFEDRTCVNLSHSADPCRSGMPFYRFILHSKESYLDCFGFCLEKGLDLSGLIYSPKQKANECRCGATPDNVGVWGSKSPPSDLLLPKDPLPEDNPNCAAGGMLVWAYAGGLEDDAVPFALIEASKTDLKYVHGVAKHKDPDSITEEGGEAPGGEEESEDSY